MPPKLDEQMDSTPLPELYGSAALAAFDNIAAFAEKASVICIGLGPQRLTHPETVQLVQRLIAELEKVPVVLDADGLNAARDEAGYHRKA